MNCFPCVLSVTTLVMRRRTPKNVFYVRQKDMDYYVSFIAAYFGICVTDIIRKSNKRQAVLIRQLCVYITLRNLPGLTLSHVANYFGYGDHTMALRCKRVCQEQINLHYDNPHQYHYYKLEKLLKDLPPID